MHLPKPRLGIITQRDEEYIQLQNEISGLNRSFILENTQDPTHWKNKAHQEPYVLFLDVIDEQDFEQQIHFLESCDHCVIINVLCDRETAEKIEDHPEIFEVLENDQSQYSKLPMLVKLSIKTVLEKYKLQQTSLRYQSFFQTSPVGLFRMNMKGELVTANKMMAQMCGFHTVVAFMDELKASLVSMFVDKSAFLNFCEGVASGSEGLYLESQIQRQDGACAWVSIKGSLTVNDVTGKSGIDFFVHDITGAKEVEEQVYYDSIHDSLTGLYNRLYIVEKLDELIRLRHIDDSSFGVLMLDLDHFQKVNDIFGHREGDRLILQIAKRLKQNYNDRAILARLGGDEFIVVFHNTVTENELTLEADRLLVLFEQPFKISKSDYRIKCSVGLRFCDKDCKRGDIVIRDADTALNRAKMNGRGRWVYFHQDFINEIKHRLLMEKDLRIAIERDQFEVFYQPIINTRTKRIDGFEALIRWMHPEKGMISPIEFIPVAEESNLIVPLGEYVLRTVVKQIKVWHLKGYNNLVGAVNTSVRQFQMTNISHLVRDILNESDLRPEALKIEVTESLAMNNVDYTISTFKDLDQSGVKISIDDFGTGYSSLSYLKKFPFHTLKIDRSFVNEIQGEGDNAEITRAIILMAQSLGLEIVAEGVENQQQLDFLEALGCDYYQGYFFSKPLPRQEFERLLERSYS